MKHRILTISLFATLVLASCGGGKTKDEKADSNGADKTALAPVAPAGADAEMTKWLGGKTLHSTKAEPKFDMYDNLKLSDDGSCVDKDNAS
ncbi:MAG: hypothetical protein IPP73_17605, partial [Chitinophagaceae bacterium]|nr:hypothetical protein [Chitinophagaceae bacterium]